MATRRALHVDDLPQQRPPELHTTGLAVESCWRFDKVPPEDWDWTPFPQPRYRFDSTAGLARVRYAGLTDRGAARERWDPDRVMATCDAEAWVVELTGILHVVDLRREATLDALGLDESINTARDADTWRACQVLGDRLRHWLPELDAIVYRSRTTPETSANLAWHRSGALQVTSARRLVDCRDLLDRLVIADGFTVMFDW